MVQDQISRLKAIGKGLLTPLITYRARDKEKIYLSFDDGPDPLVTPAILKTLDDFGVKATFFVEGRKLENYPEIARQALAAGHSLGSHTYDHKRVSAMPPRLLLDDIARMRRAFLEHLGGAQPLLFRPPYGALSLTAIVLLRWHRLRIVQWSCDSGDSHNISSRQILSNVMPLQLRRGEILLFHDDSQRTATLLPEILAHYHKNGLSFGTL